MKYIIDVPDDNYDIYTFNNELRIPWILGESNTKHWLHTGLKVTPYTEPDEIKNNKVNLCSSCELYKEHFPECGDVNVLFGDGAGNDNICCCNGYQANTVDRKAIEDEVWQFAKDIHLKSFIEDGCLYGYISEFDTYQEAKAKHEALKKQKDEIRVGDEVERITGSGNVTGLKCVVTYIDGNERMHGISQNGNSVVCSSQVNRWWRKTGRHFDEVEELLKKTKENK